MRVEIRKTGIGRWKRYEILRDGVVVESATSMAEARKKAKEVIQGVEDFLPGGESPFSDVLAAEQEARQRDDAILRYKQAQAERDALERRRQELLRQMGKDVKPWASSLPDNDPDQLTSEEHFELFEEHPKFSISPKPPKIQP